MTIFQKIETDKSTIECSENQGDRSRRNRFKSQNEAPIGSPVSNFALALQTCFAWKK